jgi:hypothetical protein
MLQYNTHNQLQDFRDIVTEERHHDTTVCSVLKSVLGIYTVEIMVLSDIYDYIVLQIEWTRI